MEKKQQPKWEDKELRKEYNKNYYANNKKRILSDLCTKIQCEICNKAIIKNNYKRHLKTPICMRQAKLNMLKNDNKKILDEIRNSNITDIN